MRHTPVESAADVRSVSDSDPDPQRARAEDVALSRPSKNSGPIVGAERTNSAPRLSSDDPAPTLTPQAGAMGPSS